MKYIAAAIIVLGIASSVFADSVVSVSETGDVRMTVRIDRQSTHVAEPIQLTLIVKAPRGSIVEFPKLQQELGPFLIRSIETDADLPASQAGNRRQWIAKITLETLTTGPLSIPPLEVEYRTPDDPNSSEILSDWETLSSQPIYIRVVSLLENRGDLTDFRDIKPVIELNVSDQPYQAWIWWIAAAVGLIGFGAAGVLLVLRKRQADTPAQWTLARIAELESQVDRIAPDAVYDELALIVNEFLVWEFGATESSTSGEPDTKSADSTLPSSIIERLGEFRSMSEEVRFAQLKPNKDQVRSVIKAARTVVQSCNQSSATKLAEAV